MTDHPEIYKKLHENREKPAQDAALLGQMQANIVTLRTALEVARAQCQLLGGETDAVNAHILQICDDALAATEPK